ncbi:MAG: helix-turn-helix transcriptional regulator [Caulobacteraceae bacterium]
MTMIQSTPAPTGRAAVLAQVKREGPVSADALAARLGLTAMAVRQHLQGLAEEELVVREEGLRQGARGRPAALWRITDAADARFADAHAGLTAELIHQIRGVFGEAGLDRLLERRTADQTALYGAAVEKKAGLRERVEALAAIREREGYMAEVRDDPESGGYLLLEHHCPICAAARLCTGLCREELALFRRVLGEGVEVERISHILAGASRCAYRITAAQIDGR